jgi:hypothetical protein
MLNLFLFLSIFFSHHSFTQVPLPPLREPKELIILAQKGRYDFMDSIYEIRNSSMERRPIRDNIDYELILPDLKKIEIDLKFPEFGVSPTDELGDYLTSCLATRFQLDDLSLKDMEIFVHFSKEETIFNGIGNQIQYLSQSPKTESEWKSIYEKSGEFIKLVSSKPKVSKLLIDNASSLQGHILSQYLFLFYKDINIDSFLLSITKINHSDNLERIIKFTANEWNKTNDPKLKLKLFRMALVASLQIRKLHDDNAIGSLQIVGETLLNQIRDLIRFDIEVNESFISESTSFFLQKDWQDLADIITNLKQDEMFPVHFKNYFYLTKKSLENPELWLFPEQIKKLQEFMDKLKLASLIDSKPKEGGYLTNEGKFFWIITSAPWNSHLILLNQWGDLFQNFPLANFVENYQKIAYFSRNKDGQIDLLSSTIELNINNDLNKTGNYVTNHGDFPFSYSLIKNFPDLKVSSPHSGKFLGLSKSTPIKINLRQFSYSSWRATVSFPKSNTRIHFKTLSACLESSFFCDFESESFSEEEWSFMRLGMTTSGGVEGFIIQRNNLTPFLLEKEVL